MEEAYIFSVICSLGGAEPNTIQSNPKKKRGKRRRTPWPAYTITVPESTCVFISAGGVAGQGLCTYRLPGCPLVL